MFRLPRRPIGLWRAKGLLPWRAIKPGEPGQVLVARRGIASRGRWVWRELKKTFDAPWFPPGGGPI